MTIETVKRRISQTSALPSRPIACAQHPQNVLREFPVPIRRMICGRVRPLSSNDVSRGGGLMRIPHKFFAAR